MACGRIDLDVAAKAFWLAMFSAGRGVGDQELADLHPLRRLERPPPPPKTQAEKELESKTGWELIRQFFSQKPKKG